MSYLHQRQKAFGYAIKGLLLFSREAHARIHFVAAVLVVAVASWLKVQLWEWLALIACIAMVMLTEIINSSIETAVNLNSPDRHPLAGKAKDLAAAAVLLAAIFAAIIGGIILLPKIYSEFI